jgi:hypothetical protein
MHFIAWLIPWPWACDSWIYSQAPRETSFCGESTISETRTDQFLPVSDNDLEYLTQEEAEQMRSREAMTDWYSGRAYPENGCSNGQTNMVC